MTLILSDRKKISNLLASFLRYISFLGSAAIHPADKASPDPRAGSHYITIRRAAACTASQAVHDNAYGGVPPMRRWILARRRLSPPVDHRATARRRLEEVGPLLHAALLIADALGGERVLRLWLCEKQPTRDQSVRPQGHRACVHACTVCVAGGHVGRGTPFRTCSLRSGRRSCRRGTRRMQRNRRRASR